VIPLAVVADVGQLEALRPVLDGRPCVIVGSAPLKTAKAETRDGECVVAINGAASSVEKADLWALNSKLQDAEGKDWPMRPLHRTMLMQGKGRSVGHVVLLRGPKYATEDATLGWLDRAGCAWASWSVIDKPTKLWFEQKHCGRKGEGEPCSAGIFIAALAFWLGAASVRLLGFSFRPGYHYMKGATHRGHVEADKRALKILRRQLGDRLDLSSVPELAA
jgi:hypothetical protein